MKKARSAAKMPVAIVPFTGTFVVLFMSDKNEGTNPSLAIAINILGWLSKKKTTSPWFSFKKCRRRSTVVIMYLRKDWAQQTCKESGDCSDCYNVPVSSVTRSEKIGLWVEYLKTKRKKKHKARLHRPLSAVAFKCGRDRSVGIQVKVRHEANDYNRHKHIQNATYGQRYCHTQRQVSLWVRHLSG